MIQEIDREAIASIRNLLLTQERKAKQLSSKFDLLVKRLDELEAAGVAFSDAHYYNEYGNWEVAREDRDRFEDVLGY